MSEPVIRRLERLLLLAAAGATLTATIGSDAAAQNARQSSVRPYINVNFCNRTSGKLYLALSYIKEPGSDDWIVEGWKNIDAHSCMDFDLARDGKVYYYAEDDGDGFWGGDELKLCVEHPGPFRRVNSSSFTCDGSELKSFDSIDPGSDASRTVNLNP